MSATLPVPVPTGYAVQSFGTIGPTTDCTNIFNSALDSGEQILVPRGIYNFDGSLVMPPYGSMKGLSTGPFSGLVDPSSTCIAPTLLVRNKAAPFIQMNGSGNALSDFLFYYPEQITWQDAAPTPYPATVQVGQSSTGGSTLERLNGINPYIFIDCEIGQTVIEKVWSGALYCSLLIDHCADYVWVDKFFTNRAYANWPLGAPASPTLDEWVLANRLAIVVRRADSLKMSNLGLFFNAIAITLQDSDDKTQNETASYGHWTGVDIDTFSDYGIAASAADNAGGGHVFGPMTIGGGLPSSQAAIITIPGGSQPPDILWSPGAARGAFAQGAIVDQTKTVIAKNVRGIDI